MSLLTGLLLSAASPEKIDCLSTPSENGENDDRVAFYLTSEKIDRLSLGLSEYDGKPFLNMTFSEMGNSEFIAMQKGRVGKSIALCLGNQLLTEPRLNEPILGGDAQISGNFTVEEVEQLIAELTPNP